MKIIDQFQSYISNKSASELVILKGIAVLTVIVIWYSFLYTPANKALSIQRNAYIKNIELHNWLTSNIPKNINQATNAVKDNGQSLLTNMTESARSQSIKLSKIQPSQHEGLRIWIEKTEFNKVIKWTDDIYTKLGIIVSDITITRLDGGFCSVSLEVSHQ